MRVIGLTVGMFQSNCYIACCESGEAIIIDPGDEAERILDAVSSESLKISAIVNTHAHIDHVSALADVSHSLKAPVYLHQGEKPIYENLGYQGSLFGLEAPKDTKIDKFIEDGDEINFGHCKLLVIHTPGHSPGSITLASVGLKPLIVFAGDTLFKGSIGRTDLFGGDFDTMLDTLRRVFLKLPDDAIVYPGHGEATTIGEEKKSNPFLIQAG